MTRTLKAPPRWPYLLALLLVGVPWGVAAAPADSGQQQDRAAKDTAVPWVAPSDGPSGDDWLVEQLLLLVEPGVVALEQTGLTDPQRLPARLGPVAITLNDDGDRLYVGLFSQLQLRFDQTVAAGGLPAEDNWGIRFRQLRPMLGGSFLQRKVRSSLQLNLAPNAVELLDLWVSYRTSEATAIRVGQFKIPFTRYRLQSIAVLSMAGWAPVSPWFGGERQIGLEVFNPAASRSGWEYGAGVFAGPNARASHAVNITRVYGETPVNRSSLASFAPPTSIHPELVARVAWNTAQMDTSANSDVCGGPLRSSIGLSVAWDIQPVQREDLAVRTAFEWLGKFYGAYLNTIGYLAWFEGREGTAFGPWGLLVEGGYRFNHFWEVALSFNHVQLPQALREDARAHAAEQIGDGSDPEANERYATVGTRRAEQEVAFTATSYLVGNSLKGQMETAWTTFSTDFGRQHLIRWLVQLQLMF